MGQPNSKCGLTRALYNFLIIRGWHDDMVHLISPRALLAKATCCIVCSWNLNFLSMIPPTSHSLSTASTWIHVLDLSSRIYEI